MLRFGFVLFGLVISVSNAAMAETACEPGDPWCRGDASDSRNWVLVDTHIDVPYRMKEAWVDVTGATEDGNFDYDRAIAGGLDLPFMSIYTPPEAETDGTAWQLANQLIDSVEAMTVRAPDRFQMVHSISDAKQAHADANKIGLALGMENGAPIAGKLETCSIFMTVASVTSPWRTAKAITFPIRPTMKSASGMD